MRFSAHAAYGSHHAYERLPERRVTLEEYQAFPFFVPTADVNGFCEEPYRTACAWGDVVVDGDQVTRLVVIPPAEVAS